MDNPHEKKSRAEGLGDEMREAETEKESNNSLCAANS